MSASPDDWEVITIAWRKSVTSQLTEAVRLLRRYRTETPLGHQPHMIAGDVDAVLRRATTFTKEPE